MLTEGLLILSLAGAIQAAGAPSPPFERPLVELSIRGAFGEPNEDWIFYFVRGRSDLYVVKRTQNNDNGLVTWAGDGQCEEVRTALAELQTLPTPQPVVPGIPRVTPPNVLPVDGIFYSLKVSSAEWADSGGWDLTFSGNYDSPLARWAQKTSTSLSECWTLDRPADIPANLG
jgi:hypothetical protein